MMFLLARRRQKLALLALLGVALSSCANVKLPKIDLPDFRSETENLGEFPSLADAPDLPDDLRTSREWDSTVKTIIRKADNFTAPSEPNRPKTAKEIERAIDRLTDSVNSYRADDPPQN